MLTLGISVRNWLPCFDCLSMIVFLCACVNNYIVAVFLGYRLHILPFTILSLAVARSSDLFM